MSLLARSRFGVQGSGEILQPEVAPRSRQRVIVATVERPQGDTGVHAHTQALLSGLAAAEVDAELVNPFCAGAKWLPVFAFRKLFLKHLSKSLALRWYRHWHVRALREALAKSLTARPIDALIAQCPVSARAALEVRDELKLDFPIAMVCHFNYSEATEYRDKGELTGRAAFQRMLAIEQRVLEAVDQVIYVSNWAQRVVEQDRGIRPRASRVIWNGIASHVDAPALRRADVGVGEGDLMLINVGSLEPRKNQISLLDLFQLLRLDNPRAKLLLVGDGPQRSAIEQKIRDRNLSGSVIMLGHRTDVPALLNLADIYVHYSKLENCPVILLEAARAGVPIAAIPNGGVGEIGEKLGGIIELRESDVNASLDALRPLTRSCDARVASSGHEPQATQASQLRRKLGGRARAGFESHFTREAMIAQYLDALNLTPAEVSR
jgi:glycosyltransferase involved in cell wall biosynthesis